MQGVSLKMPATTFTPDERLQIIKWYYGGHSAQEVVNLFIVAFEDRPIPGVQTVRNIIHNFETSKCLLNCKKCHNIQDDNEPVVRRINDEREQREVAVCGAVEVLGPCSSTVIAQEVDIPASTVRQILRRNGYRSYKVQKVQELLPEDYFRRMEFCEMAMERANRDEHFIKNILFTDECSFPLHGHHNPSVTRYWSRENLHLSVAERTQFPQKLNVWAGILGDHIVGPFFINGNLNAETYLNLIQNEILPAVQNLPNINLNQVWFQQDGCPAHNSLRVRELLDQYFQGRIISTTGDIRWPPRSPDLSVNDFFLWGYIKEIIYKFQATRANNLHELRIKIIEASQNITAETFADVRSEFYDRLGYCLMKGGGIFEPDLK